MAQVIETPADHLVCVLLDIHIWSGRRHLEKDDLIQSNPEFCKLPEKELANLGSVKICDPEDIRKFHTIKGQAERLLGRAGLPMLGAIGVPADRFNTVHDELVKMQQEFTTLARSFIAAYDQRIADWKARHLQSNPDWAPLFGNVPTAMHVAGRISFDFHPFRIAAPAGGAGQPALNARFDQQLHGLKGELMQEVADEATRFVAACVAEGGKPDAGATPREHVTARTMGPLKRAAAKLTSFRFIDPSVGPLADLIQEVLAGLPLAGRIDGVRLMRVWSLASMLSTPMQAARMAEQAQRGAGVEDLLGLGFASRSPGPETDSKASSADSETGTVEKDEPVLLTEVEHGAGCGRDLSLLL
jgi:hypothetical protein